MLPTVDQELPYSASESSNNETPSRAALADGSSGVVLIAIAALHIRRMFECRASVSLRSKVAAHWMCASDPFASWSFMPLHGLALLALGAWVLLALRGGLGRALQACRRAGSEPRSTLSDSAALMRGLEIVIACWALCCESSPPQLASMSQT